MSKKKPKRLFLTQDVTITLSPYQVLVVHRCSEYVLPFEWKSFVYLNTQTASIRYSGIRIYIFQSRLCLCVSGPSSDSDLISLLVDGDSLPDLDDGMGSSCSSPNQRAGGSGRPPSPSRTEVDTRRAIRAALFSSSHQKKDYLEKASEQISLAVQKEVEQDYASAFFYYRSGVDLLLQGVQGTRAHTYQQHQKLEKDQGLHENALTNGRTIATAGVAGLLEVFLLKQHVDCKNNRAYANCWNIT